jgi:hypothetical protein
MKKTTSSYTRRILAGGLVLFLGAILLGVASAQSGNLGDRGDIVAITSKGEPVLKLPCDAVNKFDAAFRRKIDEYIFTAIEDTLTNVAALHEQHLGSGRNPWLNELIRNLEGDALAIGKNVAMSTRVSLDTYLDRVALRMCDAIEQALNWLPPLDLDKKGREALCQALEHYYPRVQARVTDTLTHEFRLDLMSRMPQIPAEQGALMGPGEKQRIEAELTWLVETLTRNVADAVDVSLDGFYDRIHARYCE